MARLLRWSLFSLLAGLMMAVALPLALGTRVIPLGASTTAVRFEWDHPYGAGWLAIVDQTGWGWTRRARSVVSPQSYGVAGAALTLTIEHPAKPDPAFPIMMPPGGTLADVDPALAARLKASPPAGGLLAWPIQMRLGWPTRCLAYTHDGYYGWGSFGFASNGTRRISGGIPLGSQTAPFETRVVPYEVLWGGLIVNTLALGAGVLVVAECVRRLRTAGRARAGHCVACGYDIRGLTACPECGRAASVAAPAPTP